MPSHPLSLRKTRQAVSQTIDATNANAERLNQLLEATKQVIRIQGEQRELLEAFLDRGFFGRLRWLATGR